jgi:late competence protein required for DNA uptake (superfamily II DNA/RNA helicase)
MTDKPKKMAYIQIDKQPLVNLKLKNFSPTREARKQAHMRDMEKNGRWCPRCKTKKPLSEFYGPSMSGLTQTYSSYCRECLKEFMNERHRIRHENR